MSMQPLRFSLRTARSEADLRCACRVRCASYGHHLPGLRAPLNEPDELDRSPQTAVFVAFDKETDHAVGTVRVSTNVREPLQLECCTTLPPMLAGGVLAEVTRLSVLPGHDDPRVKLALMKATYLYCMARRVKWMLSTARSEALIRQYHRLGFTDLFADCAMVPLPHVWNLPHRVLGLDVVDAERNWRAARHPFYEFMVSTYHPDIALFDETDERPVAPVPVPAGGLRPSLTLAA